MLFITHTTACTRMFTLAAYILSPYCGAWNSAGTRDINSRDTTLSSPGSRGHAHLQSEMSVVSGEFQYHVRRKGES